MSQSSSKDRAIVIWTAIGALLGAVAFAYNVATTYNPDLLQQTRDWLRSWEKLAIDDFQVADCVSSIDYDGPEPKSTEELYATELFQKVPCESVHKYEVVGRQTLTTRAAAPWPGEDELGKQIGKLCHGELEQYVSEDPSELDLTISYFGPREDSWPRGHRAVVCVFAPEGGMIGTIAGPVMPQPTPSE